MAYAAAACLAAAFLETARAQVTQAVGSSALSARTTVEFRIHVPPTLQLRVVPASAPGMVRAEGGLLLEVATNLAQYDLRFELVDPGVAAVEILGLDGPVRVGPAGAVHRVFHGRGGRRRVVLGYRIHYLPGRERPAGPVPLRISAEAT